MDSQHFEPIELLKPFKQRPKPKKNLPFFTRGFIKK